MEPIRNAVMRLDDKRLDYCIRHDKWYESPAYPQYFGQQINPECPVCKDEKSRNLTNWMRYYEKHKNSDIK